eukprot:Protomagalhaensia_wolfi_Nauph_80__939@NODE_1541_length_1480_cov_45_666898_g1196_i0_p1_GENE_NODE_1541_length_1480_cov_45_666898_g1196_i0NODE_1541_length_1480_cov_45_666898_g1196_i0_p1_ORF_typecomplete_len203_score45_92Magobind/PF09282_10/1e13bZIP_Maf/PF03131_17/0_58_NODE_1541_length_1480_cov_45_666898_g1196_i04191027
MSRALVPPNAVVERSGAGETYIINEKGEKLIAATRRPDGSIRKAIKVRPGFMPIEERERFVSRGTAIRRGIEEARVMPPGVTPEMMKQPAEAKKPRKKKAAKPEAAPFFEIIEDTSSPQKKEEKQPAASARATLPPVARDIPTLQQRQKLLRNKLNDAKILQRRLNQGQQLLENQEEKVKRIPVFEEELRELEVKLAEMKIE